MYLQYYFCAFLIVMIVLVLFVVVVDCQADFDVDNVQRCELVNLYGVWRYIRVIIINVFCLPSSGCVRNNNYDDDDDDISDNR